MKVKIDGKELDVYLDSLDGKGKMEGRSFDIPYEKDGELLYHLEYEGKKYNVQVLPGDETKQPSIRVNGVEYKAELSDKYDDLIKSLGMEAMTKVTIKELKSPMPGLVISLEAKPGDSVKKGEPLMILEAMKMENVIKAKADVEIAEIHVKEGQAVEKNELLISFA